MQNLSLSENAKQRLQKIAGSEKNFLFRVHVDSGGCAGFQYKFFVDKTKKPDDILFEYAFGTVVIDPISLEIIEGSTVDYVENMMGSCFTLTNPKASSSCGCGSSFSI